MTASRRTSPTREVQDVADRLHSAALHLLRRLRAEDDALGVSPPRLSALSVVVYAGPIGIGALAAAEGVAAPTMSRLVDGLERDGLVRRGPGPRRRGGWGVWRPCWGAAVWGGASRTRETPAAYSFARPRKAIASWR